MYIRDSVFTFDKIISPCIQEGGWWGYWEIGPINFPVVIESKFFSIIVL